MRRELLQSLTQRRWLIAVTAVTVVAILTIGLTLLLNDHGRRIPPARTRTTIAFTACLLTDAHGVTGTTAAPAWQGILKAQAATNMKAQSLQVTEKGRVAEAVIGVNTLAQRSCNLVIATGELQTAAVWQQATTFRRQHFLVITTTPHRTARNVAVVPSDDAATIITKVATTTKNAVAGHFTPGDQ
jgi:basic membrane lipoprotein Med (substrate-binding protein (PBP1-ABC) superfamily)